MAVPSRPAGSGAILTAMDCIAECQLRGHRAYRTDGGLPAREGLSAGGILGVPSPAVPAELGRPVSAHIGLAPADPVISCVRGLNAARPPKAWIEVEVGQWRGTRIGWQCLTRGCGGGAEAKGMVGFRNDRTGLRQGKPALRVPVMEECS